MDYLVLAVFCLVYLGMLLGSFPGLALDRSGIALLGAIALIAAGRLSVEQAQAAVDFPTLALLFGLMVVSAQFRLGGFYSQVTTRLALAQLTPPQLLALLIGVAGLLSALLANDVVCLAVAPVLALGCLRRGLNPLPFLLALACASNIGSAATLIGNPQNMLIGQVLKLSFAGYLQQALLPSLLGLAALWGIVCLLYKGRWEVSAPAGRDLSVVHAARVQAAEPAALTEMTGRWREDFPYDAWQTGKGLLVLALLVLAFLISGWPRDVLALGAAGILLTSRRMASREILGQVDWHLLTLFTGLFIVNAAFRQSGWMDSLLDGLQQVGIDPARPAALFGLTALLSNLVSNVPAVMLLLPAARYPLAGPVLALSSTLAGNLLIVGSIANIIVVDQAARLGIRISWGEHARTGIPVTLASLALAWVWLLLWLH